MLELGAIELLVSLTFNQRMALRLNAVWALMVSRSSAIIMISRSSTIIMVSRSSTIIPQQL